MTLVVFGSTLLIMITYWTVGGIYIIMDLTLKPNSLRKYKVQPGKNEPVERIKLYKVSF
jgi:hypothetical protein